jgi:NTE family protein
MSALYRALVAPLVARIRRVGQGAHKPSPLGLGLALGGGFARGFAHIGVLKVLEENCIPIACIADTSVGSILGAAYATGASVQQLAEVCTHIQFKDFARWKVSRLGLASNDRMAKLIERCFGGRTFEELRIPMAVVATDLATGEPVVFRHGSLVEPIRASCAFPGLFEPVTIGRRCLADGGLSAPVPAKAAAWFGVRRVLAVSVGFNNWSAGPPKDIFQVLSRAVSIAQKHRNPSWERFADIVLEPQVQHLEWNDFERARECIRAGETAARMILPRLRELLYLPEPAPEHVDAATRVSGTPAVV